MELIYPLIIGLFGALIGFILSLLGNLLISRNRTTQVDQMDVKIEELISTTTRHESNIANNADKIAAVDREVTTLNATYKFLEKSMTEIKTAIVDGFNSVNKRMDDFAKNSNQSR